MRPLYDCVKKDEREEALENIKGQLENGYIDLGTYDDLELEIVKEAIKLYEEGRK